LDFTGGHLAETESPIDGVKREVFEETGFIIEVMSLKEREFVKAASTFGARQSYILYKHILPGIYPLAIAKFINTVQSAIVTEASLSFLGLGDVSEISWGMMLHYAFQCR
jgi:peptide/nickel transport system permease protein